MTVIRTELLKLSHGPRENVVVYLDEFAGEWPDPTYFPRVVFTVESSRHEILNVGVGSFDRIHAAVHERTT